MFGFLKDKLKSALKKFSSDAKEEVVEEQVEAPVENTPVPKKVVEKKPVEKKAPAKKPAAPKVAPAPIAPLADESAAAELEAEFEQLITPEDVTTLEDAHTPARLDEETTVESEAITPAPVREEEEPDEDIVEPAPSIEQEVVEPPKKEGFFSRMFHKKEEPKVEQSFPEPVVEESSVQAPAELSVKEEESSFFGKLKDAVTKKTLSEEKFDELFFELELAMLENNVAVEVIEKIKQDLKEELTTGKVSRMGVDEMIAARLRQSVEELFEVEGFDLIEKIKSSPKPYKVCIIGVNGSGKTTTLAKIIKKLQDNKLSVVVAASDTFRAAAIDQLKQHTDKLGVKLISQGYNADPAAVAFDAVKHAQAQNVDVVLIDTAGRLHSNTNLMAELEKVVRVSKPDLKIFVGEAITGNDCVEQAKVFNELVGIDAIILSKADIDEKGGAAISVSFITGKPILYLGTGQTYDDLIPFDKHKVIEAVGL